VAAQNNIRSEQSVIDRLNRTNQALVAELGVDHRNARASNQARRGALHVDAQIDVMIRKVEEKKIDLEELDHKVRDLEKSIFCLRRVRGGQSASQENTKNIERQVKVLEGRLANKLSKCNTIVEENRGLRRQIDERRRQRATYDIIFRNVSASIVDTKRRTAEVLAHPAFAEREALKRQMSELEATAERENDEFERAWRGHQDSLEWHLVRDVDLDKLRDQFAKEAAAEAAGGSGDEGAAGESQAAAAAAAPAAVGFAEVLHRIRPGMSAAELNQLVASVEESLGAIAALKAASQELAAETRREAEAVATLEERYEVLKSEHSTVSHAASTASHEQRRKRVQEGLAALVAALAPTDDAEEGSRVVLDVLRTVEGDAKRWIVGRAS
jgi:chromosome segregation ATPase